MKKVKLVKIGDYNLYTFSDGKNEYKKNIFFEDFKPSVGDILFFPNKVLEEINLFTYGPLLKDTKAEEAIKIIHDGKEIFMSRYYG